MTEQQTAQTPLVEATAYWNPERDLPRGRAMHRVEIVNRSTLNLQVPHGYLLQPGRQMVDLYVDEIPIVQSLVEPRPDALEQAHASYRLAIAEDAKIRVEFSGDAEKFLTLVDSGDAVARESFDFVQARTQLSPEAMFRQTMKRDALPLTSVRVIAENVPEPKRESVKLLQSEQDRYTGTMGEAIGVAIAQAQAPLLALLADQQKAMAELLKQISRK